MSNEHQEIWNFLAKLNYSEEEKQVIYNSMVKEGFTTLKSLKEDIYSEEDLKNIGIDQLQKRRSIYKALMIV